MNQLIRARSTNNHLTPVAFFGQHLVCPTRKKGRSIWLCTESSCLNQLPKRTKQIKKALQNHADIDLFQPRLQEKLITLSTSVLRKAHQSGQLIIVDAGESESYEISKETLEATLPNSMLIKLHSTEFVEKAAVLRPGKWTSRAEKILHTLEQLQLANTSPVEGSAIVFLKRVPKSHGIG